MLQSLESVSSPLLMLHYSLVAGSSDTYRKAPVVFVQDGTQKAERGKHMA